MFGKFTLPLVIAGLLIAAFVFTNLRIDNNDCECPAGASCEAIEGMVSKFTWCSQEGWQSAGDYCVPDGYKWDHPIAVGAPQPISCTQSDVGCRCPTGRRCHISRVTGPIGLSVCATGEALEDCSEAVTACYNTRE